jgi:glycosyltransferase involved in cell wall biosynthesis
MTPSPQFPDFIPENRPTIFLVATHTATSKAKTGIQTVVRGLISGLVAIAANVRLVRRRRWRRHFSSLSRLQCAALGLPERNVGLPAGKLDGAWLLVPEVVYDRETHTMMRDAHKRGMRVAAIFHDAIPISHPDRVRREAARYHAAYMKVLTELDLLFAVSNTAAQEFRDFAVGGGLHVPRIHVCSLAGEINGTERQRAQSKPSNGPVRILCVSTLDPRKNHAGLIEAFDAACSYLPETELFLELVGAPYKGAHSIVKIIQSAAATNRRITWHGSVTPDELRRVYAQCDFTVYPSIAEGFGLPILESLWCGRPCICANFGAMAETGAGGGCLMVDVRDSKKLARAIVDVATQPQVRDRLASEIGQRRFKTWSEYAGEICAALSMARGREQPDRTQHQVNR